MTALKQTVLVLGATAVLLLGISLLMATGDERRKSYKEILIWGIGLSVALLVLHWFGLF